jgi:hypothetical protein
LEIHKYAREEKIKKYEKIVKIPAGSDYEYLRNE